MKLKKLKKAYLNNRDYLVTFALLLILSFSLPRLMPGDPVQVILGGSEGFSVGTDAVKAEVAKRLGLDLPIYQQFGTYLSQLIHLDFGYSYVYGRPVLDMVLKALPWTLLLVTSGMSLTLTLGLSFGLESALNQNNPFDRIATTLLVGISGFPQFLLGVMLLMFFGNYLNWFPVSGGITAFTEKTGMALCLDVLNHLTLPLMTLVLTEVSGVFLLVRNTAVRIKKELFFQIAIDKAYSKKRLKHDYLKRNIILPMSHYLGMRLGKIMVGELMIEVVFSYPGLGSLIYNSVANRDYPVLQAMLILMATTVLVMTALTEAVNRYYGGIRGGSKDTI